MYNISTLDNGIKVVSYSMQEIRSVVINLIVKIGGKYEEENEHGMCHFLEHMAFKGTKKRSYKQIAEEFDVIGGQFNAYTSKEHTVYYTKVLNEHVDTALDILADIVQDSVFAPSEIAKECGVIEQEIAQYYDDPDDHLFEQAFLTAYPNQPIGRTILGTRETIIKFDSDRCKEYMRKHYRANSIVLSVAGNIEHKNFESRAEKFFGSVSKSKESEKKIISHYKGGHCSIERNLEQTILLLGFESTNYMDRKKFYHTQMLSLILGGSMSSRLFQEIREKLGLAYSVNAFSKSYSDTGLFMIYAGVHPHNVLKLVDNLVIEIHKICDAITDEELERGKKQLKASILMAQDNPSHKAENIGKNVAIFNQYFPPEEIIEQIYSISKSDISNIAFEIFFSKQLLLGSIGSNKQKISYDDVNKRFKANIN